MRQIFLFDKNVVFAGNVCIFPVIAIAHVITLTYDARQTLSN